MHIVHTIGNKELWRREKTLFLTSRRAPLGCYEKVFRWVEEFDKWQCAVCFNTSELEEEVLKALLEAVVAEEVPNEKPALLALAKVLSEKTAPAD